MLALYGSPNIVKAEVEAKVTSVFEKIQGIPANIVMSRNLRVITDPRVVSFYNNILFTLC